MQAAAFTPEKFPFTTKDPELLEEINKVFKSYNEPNMASVTEQAKGT